MYQSEHKHRDELSTMHTIEYYPTQKRGMKFGHMLQPGLTVRIYIKSKGCMTVWSCSSKALEQLSWDGGRLSVSRARVEGGHWLWD